MEGVWDVVEASNQTAKQKQEMYEIIMSSGASDENATLARQTAMEKLATNIQSAQRIGGSGYYGDDDAGDLHLKAMPHVGYFLPVVSLTLAGLLVRPEWLD